MYMFDKLFASISLLTRKNWHNIEVDTCCAYEERKCTSIDMLEIEMTRITKKVKYYEF